MRTRAVFLLVLSLACTSKESTIPEGVLQPERFEKVLLEAQLIEARMNHELVVTRQNVIPGTDYYARMFQEQGVSKEEFEQSFAYYSGQPEVMKGMYESIITELVRRKDELPQ